MTAPARRWAFLAGGAVLLGLLGWAMTGLPGFGAAPAPVGQAIARAGVPERGATDIVTIVNLDYRGFDTIGEELILFTAVAAVVVLLRRERTEVEGEPEDIEPARDEAVVVAGAAIGALALLFGFYLVTHGQLTPGGGFQGGASIASGLVLVYLAAGYRPLARLLPEWLLEAAEGSGAGTFIAIGLASLPAGAAFLQDVLPRGEVGSVDSAGTVTPIYVAIGVAVAAGFALILLEILTQEEVIRPRRGRR